MDARAFSLGLEAAMSERTRITLSLCSSFAVLVGCDERTRFVQLVTVFPGAGRGDGRAKSGRISRRAVEEPCGPCFDVSRVGALVRVPGDPLDGHDGTPPGRLRHRGHPRGQGGGGHACGDRRPVVTTADGHSP
jgi:hypothetical protein